MLRQIPLIRIGSFVIERSHTTSAHVRLRSIPRLDAREGDRLVPIRGLPPIVSKLPPGCPFRPRCDFAVEACGQVYPARRAFGEGHFAHCHNPRQVEGPA